jgi:hypothetical protein
VILGIRPSSSCWRSHHLQEEFYQLPFTPPSSRQFGPSGSVCHAAPPFGPYGPADVGRRRAGTMAVRWCSLQPLPLSGTRSFATAPPPPRANVAAGPALQAAVVYPNNVGKTNLDMERGEPIN